MHYRVKEIREKNQMSQEELAKKSDVSRQIIANLESGRDANTTASTLSKLARALHCKVSDLFFESNV